MSADVARVVALGASNLLDTAERVNAGLAELSATFCAKFFRLDPAWYGFDPIHVRPALRRSAWQQILGTEPQASSHRESTVESLRLYLMRPERRWLFGIEQLTPQSGVALPSGGRVWLY